jgi:hypothetical protein
MAIEVPTVLREERIPGRDRRGYGGALPRQRQAIVFDESKANVHVGNAQVVQADLTKKSKTDSNAKSISHVQKLFQDFLPEFDEKSA